MSRSTRRPRRSWIRFRSHFRAAWLVWPAIAIISSAVVSPPAAGQQSSSEPPVRIQNERLLLEFRKVTKGGRSHILLESIRSKTNGHVFDLSRSPLVSVGLQQPGSANNQLLSWPPEQEPMTGPTQQVVLRQISPAAVELEYSQIEIPELDQRLNVTVRVSLRPAGGSSQWTGTAELTGGGAWCILDLRLPYLRCTSIGPNSADDVVAYPMTGGLRLTDPIRHGQSLRAREASSMYNYPGYVESQFVAYYDDSSRADTVRGGLYLAAEDAQGYIKKLYFKPSFDARSLDVFIQHYNFAPAASASGGLQQSKRALASIAIGTKLPYVAVLDSFAGDWIDAADKYRHWLESAHPQMLSAGKLAQRGDIPSSVRQSAYAFAYVLAGGTEPLPPQGVDFETIRKTLAFFTDSDGKPLSAAIAFVGDVTARKADASIANDMGVFEQRPGLVDFLWELHQSPWGERLVSMALNRDIGNWVSSRAQNQQLVLSSGLIKEATGQTLQLAGRQDPRFAPGAGAVKGIVCGSSPLMMRMRLDQFERSFQRFVRQGVCVLSNTALSGRGTESALCYAPLFDDRSDNSHTIGGGNDWTIAYRKLVHQLRKRYAPQGMHILPIAERAHEQMIDTSELSGRARVAPWDLSFHGPANWVQNGQPIPIRSYLFHDYALLGARLPRLANVVRVYLEAHQSAGHPLSWQQLIRDSSFLTLQRQRLAQWTVEGHRLGLYVQGPGPSVDPARLLDGTPGDAPQMLRGYHRFLREMVRLRQRAAAYLVDGRMLRPPTIHSTSGGVKLMVADRGGLATLNETGVSVGAWRAADGSTAIILANYSPEATAVALRFDRSWPGFAGEQSRGLRVLDQEDGDRIGLHEEDGQLVTEPFQLSSELPTTILLVDPT